MIQLTATPHQSHFPTIRNHSFLIAGIMFLLCGCLIYVIWRSRETNLCRWADASGLGFVLDFLRSALGKADPGDFVRYNLADGLYCIAYILIMHHIWSDQTRWIRLLSVSLIPLVAVIHEAAQGLGAAVGTFDMLDLICYILPLVAYLIYDACHRRKKVPIIHCFTSKSTAT